MPLEQDGIQAYLRQGVDSSLSQKEERIVSSRFRYIQSNLDLYSSLPTDPLGSFDLSFNRQTTPLTGAKQADLPMIISVIPPDVYPSDRTVRATIPTPSTATFDLVRLKSARNSPANGVDQNSVVATSTVDVPVDPQFTIPTYLRSRRKDFEADAKAAQTILEFQDEPEVIGRAQENDTYVLGSQEMQDVRSGANDLRTLKRQAEQLRDLPSIVMLVNPNNMTCNYNHIISAGDRSRTGFIVEHWGEQLPTLSISGNTGGFYLVNRFGGGGITAYQEGSAAYQQFITIFQIYRNNAYLRNEDSTIGLVGAVEIYYDGKIYTGSFNAFNFTEDEAKPFSLDYSFEFTVRYETDIRTSY